MAKHITRETSDHFHVCFRVYNGHQNAAVSDNDPVHFLILMNGFPMIAEVVVGETYDRRDDGQQSLNYLYAFRASCWVVVCETYDRSDDVRFSHTFCKLFVFAARVVVVN